MTRLQAETALASDVSLLMDALPSLAEVQRYSDVRQTDAALLGTVTDGLVARICIGLPGACASLNDEAAQALFALLEKCNGAINLLQDNAHTLRWQETLFKLADQQGLHGLLAGRACRMLLDGQVLAADDAAQRLSLALSLACEPTQAGTWVEGFLHGSGLLLLHDQALWQVLDDWGDGVATGTIHCAAAVVAPPPSPISPRPNGGRWANRRNAAGAMFRRQPNETILIRRGLKRSCHCWRSCWGLQYEPIH
jgi:hypothetical protein